MTVSRAHVSTHWGDVIYLEAVRWPVNYFTRSRSMLSLILSSKFGIGAQENWYTYWTSMLWSIDSCQNKVTADQYHLTVSRAQVSTHWGQVFFWSYPLTRYWFSNDRRLKLNFFSNSYEICRVYVPHNWNFDFKLTSDAKIQPAATGREGSCFWLFSPCSRVGHALRPIFMLWLVKIWQVSSCGKFMQHLESCLLWQLKLTEFCVNLWCF